MSFFLPTQMQIVRSWLTSFMRSRRLYRRSNRQAARTYTDRTEASPGGGEKTYSVFMEANRDVQATDEEKVKFQRAVENVNELVQRDSRSSPSASAPTTSRQT